MPVDKSLQTGSTSMLILKLIEQRDMYGYEMIEALLERSNNVFSLKAGTLYPLLKLLEEKGYVTSYEQSLDKTRVRKYYSITNNGRIQLQEKQQEWLFFVDAINNVIKGEKEIVTFG